MILLYSNRLEFLFYHYGVDLILESNENSYERTYPVIKDGDFFESTYSNIDMPIHISLPSTIANDSAAVTVAVDKDIDSKFK